MEIGGIFDHYIQFFKNFLNELQQGEQKQCDFVFFIKERSYFNEDQEKDKLREQHRHKDNAVWNSFRNSYYITIIAKEYGQIIASDTGHCNVIVKYANEHADKVLAIITNNTSVLLIEGKFQYWSMAEWPNKSRLRFDRDALLDELKISSEQLRLAAALTGLVGNCHRKKTFTTVVEYARRQNQTPENIFDWQQIADDLPSTYCVSSTAETIVKYYNESDINYCPPVFDYVYCEYASPVMLEALQFCKQNHLSVYHAIKSSGHRFLALTDLFCLNPEYQISKDFTNAIFTVLTKISGVFYKNEDPEKRPKMQLFFNPFVNNGEIERRNLLYPGNFNAFFYQLTIFQLFLFISLAI